MTVRSAIHLPCAASWLCCGLVFFSAAHAADWPQWRGPRADGSVTGPVRVAALADRPAILWKRQVGGGYSGPIVSGNRIWVHSRQGGDEVVSCLDLSSGETVWRQSYAAAFHQDDNARSHGSGPYATPTLNDGRLFTFGVTSVLIAWDAATGKLLWRQDSADDFDPSFPYFGAAASPVVWQDLVFIHFGGHERGGTGTASRGPMVALRVADGGEVWRWSGDGPAVGASPVIAEIGAQPQLVFKTNKLIVGVDSRSGKEIWRIPFRVSQDNTIVTPLIVNGCLITSDFDWGIAAWDLESRGTQWSALQRWKHRDVSLFMSSPVLAGGLLVGFSHLHGGQLFLLDPKTGEVHWRGSGRSGEHASLVAWGDEAMAFMDDGSLIVGKVEDHTFRRVKTYRLGDSIAWSHPAVVGSRIVYRDGSNLAVCQLVD